MKNNIRIEYYDTLPSTNYYLKSRGRNEDERLIIVAKTHTQAHGRFNRKFYSPKDCGIYMSFLLKPKSAGFDATLITSAAAVAVARATEALSGKKTQIKWVNDILISGKKICGILTEGSINPTNGSLEYVVLGIGINVFLPQNGFDDEIKDIAGYVFEKNDPVLKKRLTQEIIDNVFYCYNNLDKKEFLKDYRQKSVVIGKRITVIKGNGTKTAKAILIDDDCRLKVEYSDKTTEFLQSGEISIKI